MDIAQPPEPTAPQDLFLDTLARTRVSHPRNLCARFLTGDLFLSFDAAQRERLLEIGRSGAQNPDSIVGCYILRPGDLAEFAAFFDPLIRAHHGVLPTDGLASVSHPSAPPDREDLDLAALGFAPLSMRVRVGRNLRGFSLPAGMDRAERVRLEQAMTRALQVLTDDPAYGGRIYSLTPDFGPDGPNPNRIGPRQHQALADAHLMFRSMAADPYMQSAGLAGDWSYGRACYISADRSVVVWIGEEDHLRVVSIRTGTNLLDVYDRLRAVLAIIEATPGIGFVQDDTYGYVTSCPSNLGTGLRASVRVTMPALVRPGVDTRAVCAQFGLTASGLPGDRAPLGQDGRLDLSPIRRLFIADHDVLAGLIRGLRGLTSMD